MRRGRWGDGVREGGEGESGSPPRCSPPRHPPRSPPRYPPPRSPPPRSPRRSLATQPGDRRRARRRKSLFTPKSTSNAPASWGTLPGGWGPLPSSIRALFTRFYGITDWRGVAAHRGRGRRRSRNQVSAGTGSRRGAPRLFCHLARARGRAVPARRRPEEAEVGQTHPLLELYRTRHRTPASRQTLAIPTQHGYSPPSHEHREGRVAKAPPPRSREARSALLPSPPQPNAPPPLATSLEATSARQMASD